MAVLGTAVAFGLAGSGANLLFKQFDKNNSEAEIKRHDLAIEKLQKANVEWNKSRAEKIDFANQQLKKEQDAAVSFKNANDSLYLYNELHPTNKIYLDKKPELSDYYTPSQEMKNYEYLWIILGLSITGLIVYKLMKKNKKKL